MNAIHYGKKEHIETKMEAWSNDTYERVPFTCDAKLDDNQLRSRLGNAICKRFKPSHFGGCGYSCNIVEVKRESKTSGFIVIKHYHGIGD